MENSAEKVLADLVEAGCHMETQRLLFNIGRAEFTGPKTIRFCAPYPEHQGHVHEVTGEPKIFPDGEGVGLGLMEPDGENFVAYFSVDVQWPELSRKDREEAAKARTQWRAGIEKHNNQARFEDFFREAISD